MAAVIASAGVLLGGPPSDAVAPPVTVASALLYRYIPGDTTKNRVVDSEVRVAEGGRLFFANADPSAAHTLSAPLKEDGTRLFDSGYPIAAGEVLEVQGVSTLPPGSYVFLCKLHTSLMRGQLVIEPAA